MIVKKIAQPKPSRKFTVLSRKKILSLATGSILLSHSVWRQSLTSGGQNRIIPFLNVKTQRIYDGIVNNDNLVFLNIIIDIFFKVSEIN